MYFYGIGFAGQTWTSISNACMVTITSTSDEALRACIIFTTIMSPHNSYCQPVVVTAGVQEAQQPVRP